MSITVQDNHFKLDTCHSSYCFSIMDERYPVHTYYGAPVADADLSYLFPRERRSYTTASPGKAENYFYLDEIPQEFSTCGVGDYRLTAVEILNGDGSRVTEGRYQSYRIYDGVKDLPDMPNADNSENDAQTLEITLADPVSGAEIVLGYTVFEKADIIARWTEIRNAGKTSLTVEKAMSMQLDLTDFDFDFVQLFGNWAKERQLQRTPLQHGCQGFYSKHGTTGHQHAPFFSLCRPSADEDHGDVYGFNLVYSGNHMTDIEVGQYDTVRCEMGIYDGGFAWKLEPGETFVTPQVLMTFSDSGLGTMSRSFHRFIREHLYRPQWRRARRPILINNWEATYFDFNEEKLLKIADTAHELGIDMLVMDDGWFGRREDDRSSLGDWQVNREKLPLGLTHLAQELNRRGMKFGLWLEPEMISPDSDLYRAHPDWCIHIPGRDCSEGRNQLVLDLVRPEVRDYIWNCIRTLLLESPIAYIKWDMNRYLTEAYSISLPADRQGEMYHRFVLAVYDLMERLNTEFPDVLLENCSGGGGRFDAAMMHYSPQIWTSDDTDAMERVGIQYGTSFAFPVSAMGSHVSAVPNHQTKRTTPLSTRGALASSGTFGYELDLSKLPEEEKLEMKEQCRFYKEHYELINFGDYYRLQSPFASTNAAWCFVSPEKDEALAFFVKMWGEAENSPKLHCRLTGLDETKRYVNTETGVSYSGSTLCHAGIPIPASIGDAVSFVFHFKQI